MNLIGKIFVVLILVMSVLFMAFAMAVYATHRNWMKESRAEHTLLTNEQTHSRQLSDEMEQLKRQFDAAKAENSQTVTKLKTELDVANGRLKKLEDTQAGLEEAKRTAETALNTTQANATDYRKERDTQRTTVHEAQQDRDAHFKELLRVTEAMNQAVSDRDQLKTRTLELTRDLARADTLLRKFGLDKNKDYSGVPPKVEGRITATPGEGLVEISIGADQGLIRGHRLEVYRIGGGQSTYVGRIEVVSTAPDRSVCRIDPKFQNANMMVGDRVASKID